MMVLAAVVALPVALRADAVVYFSSSAAPEVLGQFLGEFGGTNNGTGGGAYTTGYRTLTWDDVPEGSAAPNNLPANFYTATVARGAGLSAPGIGFQVSAASGNPTGTPLNFGNIDPSYATTFQAFSSPRLFTALDSTAVTLSFFLPGMPSAPAWVSGFGAVFSDVDLVGSTTLDFLGLDNSLLFQATVPRAATDGGLSFLGVYFNGGEQIGGVRINSGNSPLGPGVLDGNGIDLVVMDDFFFGEPQVVPEPSVCALLGLGGLCWLAGRIRQWKP